MTIHFSKCQEAEMTRMEFFKTTFYKLEEILNITKTNRQVLTSEPLTPPK